MSGSGGSGGGGGGFGGPDTIIECDRLVINTQLSSPKSEVVDQLDEGTELDVSLESYPGTTVVVAKFNGAVAGGLASPETSRLRRCIEQGTNYSATVIDITGGQVRVRVHPAQAHG